MWGWYHDGGFGAGGWITMIAMMTIFWSLVVAAGVMIFRGGTSDSHGSAGNRSGDRAPERGPMDILDERFARGELDREEYEARRAVLQGVARSDQ